MTFESIISQILSAVWFILPAYLSNGGALVFGGGKPLDMGGVFLDGRRILGDGVTIRGTFSGIIVGVIAGLVEGAIESNLYFGAVLGLALGAGAMAGDSFGSFLKRRIGMERGKPAPGLDQMGFLVFAIAFAGLITRVSFTTILILLLITPALHLVTNVIAFQLGMKKIWY